MHRWRLSRRMRRFASRGYEVLVAIAFLAAFLGLSHEARKGRVADGRAAGAHAPPYCGHTQSSADVIRR